MRLRLGNYTFLTPGLARLRPNDYAVARELASMGFSNSTCRNAEYRISYHAVASLARIVRHQRGNALKLALDRI